MAARNATQKQGAAQDDGGRYQPLPTGTHGLEPEQVQLDQRRRLREAMIELIATHGYQGVRIADLAKLAHVSAPTFYGLYANKEQLFRDVYEEITTRTVSTVLSAYRAELPDGERLPAALEAFAELAAESPKETSVLVLGAFGAGHEALERRRVSMTALERSIQSARDGESASEPEREGNLIVKAILGGIREVTATRLRTGRHDELPGLAPALAAWAGCYPRHLPRELLAPPSEGARDDLPGPSARAKRAEGPLPSGRSEMPRGRIEKSQRERIVDATAAIVAEKGLAGLTIPEIVRRANISNQTFYAIYPSKRDAFLGAQKVSMHQALVVTGRAYEAHGEDWPRAVAAGIAALLSYLASEPAHARLTLVDTFGASPRAMEIRGPALAAFRVYLNPGFDLAGDGAAVPELAAEAITGGIWQILHHYTEHAAVSALAHLAPQLTFFALTPFLGPVQALAVATSAPAA
jgi:AcrR family transcriptional regulator